MAEEYNPHHHQEEPVECSDRGLFGLMKKNEKADKPVQEEVFVSELEEKVQVSEQEEKKHDHGSGLHEKLHRSGSFSSSSSDEEEGDDEEKKKRRQEKKSIKDKIKEKLHKDEEKHEEKAEVGNAVPVDEKIHVEEVVYSDPSHPVEEKKGFLDKIKDKLPGQHKKTDDVATPPPPPPPVVAECETPEHEKKGCLVKIKDKIPGFHHKAEEEEKKEKEQY